MPAVTRHFDLLQHLVPVSSTLPRYPSFFSPSAVSINLDDVPQVERKSVIEKKERKPKKTEPAEDSTAAATKAENPKTAKEAVKAAAASASEEQTPATMQQGKKEKKGKDKAAVEGKAKGDAGGGGKKGGAAPAADLPPAPSMIDLRVGKIIEGMLLSSFHSEYQADVAVVRVAQ